MNWKQYQNEFIALGAGLILLFAYSYKYTKVTSSTQEAKTVQTSIENLKEVISLKKIWVDKKIGKKIENLQTLVPSNKVKWSKKSKKITANYTDLGANELNKLTTKILGLPVIITLFNVEKIGSNYKVDLKCKW
ncbi:MAG: hypothetical protein L3J43_06685 [Sulfurovum sp.]|nr:hypothetical protein [Sulfurovum sp.]